MELTESALAHGYTETHIEECLFNDDPLPLIMRSTQDKQVYVAYGMTFSGQYLEVCFRLHPRRKNVWLVFHAMLLRDKQKRFYKQKRGL